MWMGKEIPFILGIRNRFIQHKASPVRMFECKTLSDICLILFFSTGHPVYLHNVGFLKFSPTTFANIFYYNIFFWLLSSIFGMLVTIVEIGHLKADIVGQMAKVRNVKSELKDEAKQELKAKKAQYFALWLDLIRAICDLPA